MIFEIVPVGDNTIMATVDMNEVYAKGIAFAQSPDAAGRSIQIPSGLILDTVSGVISGTPTKAGKYAFYAIAINEYGVEGSAAFDVILLDVHNYRKSLKLMASLAQCSLFFVYTL